MNENKIEINGIKPIFDNRQFLQNVEIVKNNEKYLTYNKFISNYSTNSYLQLFVDTYLHIYKNEGLIFYFKNDFDVENKILLKQKIVSLIKTDVKLLSKEIENEWGNYSEVLKLFKEINNKEILGSVNDNAQSLEYNKKNIDKAKYQKNWIRLFAVELLSNKIIITGGLIKHSNKIESTDIGFNEFYILDNVLEYCNQNIILGEK